MRLLATGLLLLLAPIAVMAVEETSLRVTLDKAIQMALSRNFQIQVEAYSPRIARERVTGALGIFDPRLDASYDRNEATDRRTAASHLETDSADIGFTGLTPWGLKYDAGITTHNRWGNRDDTNSGFETSAAFGLQQPLLRDFGVTANLAQVRIARKSEQISEWQMRQRVIDVVTQIYFVYNDLYFTMENFQVAQRSRELARQLFQDNSRRAEIGVMSPLDVTTARAEVATREEAVILADRAVRDNENFLKQLITHDIERILTTRIVIEPPPIPAPFTVSVPDGVNDALLWRPDYRQALLDIQRRRINVAYQRNQALPRFDLKGSLNLLGLDSNFATSFGNATSSDRSEWSAGAVFSVPLPNREGRARANQAQLESAQALLDLQRLEQEIVVRVDNAAGEIITSRQRIDSTSVARILARESLAAGEEKLRAGTSTTFEVLELQKKLAEAEVAELRARADYNKAVSEYGRQTGTALERNHIVLGQ